ERRAQRQLRDEAAGRPLRPRRPGAVHARVRAVGPPAEEAGRERHGRRQAAPRSRLLRSLDLFPAHRRGSPHDRTDRDGVEGNPGCLLRGDDPHRPGSRDGPAANSAGAADDSGPPARPDQGRPRAELALEIGGEVSAPRRWRLSVPERAGAATNMAIDEALWRGRQAGSSAPTVRFFAWAPPTVSLGYGQPLDRHVDVEACRALSVGLVRRPTGGSAIYHDGPE